MFANFSAPSPLNAECMGATDIGVTIRLWMSQVEAPFLPSRPMTEPVDECDVVRSPAVDVARFRTDRTNTFHFV